MAFIDDALKQILSDNAAVVALVGTRIYSPVLQQGTLYPAVAYRNPDTERDPLLASRSTGPPRGRFAFFSVAKDPVGSQSAKQVAKRLDRAIRLALQGYSGPVTITSLSPQETLTIQGIFVSDSADRFDDDTKTYEYGTAYDVHFAEEVPD